jgi:hypothetical protein
MATIDKNFRIKNGLVVEGSTATVNGNQILTENASDQYILNLIGGETLVKSVTGNLSVDNAGQLSINETGLADSLTVDSNFLYDDGQGHIMLDSEGVYDDLIAGGVATTTNISDAIADEVTRADAAYDASGAAGTAEQNAKNYADGLAVNYDAAGSATTAENNAKGYADSLAGNYDPAGAADTALQSAEGYADQAAGQALADAENYTDTAITNLNLSGTYDALGAATTALNDAKAYTDQEVSALVDSAPALLDTLNELAAAIADNPNYATDVANLVATKADTTYVDSEISGVDTAAQGYATTAENNAKSYADGLASNYDAAGSATTAENNAKSYADGLASNYDAAGAASTALADANSYTDSAISNGDSNATPTYQGVNLGAYTQLISGWNSVSNGATFSPVSWNSAYGTAKLTVHVRDGVHSQASEVLIARDSSNNIAITEYAIVTTNGIIADVSASYSNNQISLTVSPTNGHTTVEAIATGSAIVWAD